MSKITKKISRSPKKQASSLLLFMMETMREYLQGAELSREQRLQRRKKLASHIKKGEGTLKNMYLYGQGHPESWFAVMDFIHSTQQSDVIQLYTSHSYMLEKLSELSVEQKRMHSFAAKMSEQELKLVNDLIEIGLKANRKK
tara:strand:+ start:11984 stop:12409 length:426 start_codon:yes stop_codon:yes gene_type:complete